ncbi:uncharacterized protein LY89DRAFT_787845 [Mollisia scopiformis]|uniref:Zn(2)-C6 fungal-type domain-containing protein n=1 Tax=Mollisia scopiformis TaxID=149040 RepID=A0A132BAY6_MOLSC|nr:uncharacterized protein LY89DRAFT_787845 [Mollisia scopiformis]KUJ09538.1 hypothetical protein LY89DRAFT_787845 [Mollisia scopiformis]
MEDNTQGAGSGEGNVEDNYVANSASPENSTASSGVRKRISKACDHCNSARRKCDGHQPCSYCLRTRSRCSYKRQAKKRGKTPASASKKLSASQTVRPPSQTPLQELATTSTIATEASQIANHVHGISQEVQRDRDVHSVPTDDLNESTVEGFTFSPLVDDYQMFDFDPGWGIEDFGDAIENASLLNLNGSTNIHEGMVMGPSEMLLESTNLDPSNQSRKNGAPRISSSHRVTYGIHSFMADDEGGTCSIRDTSSVPSQVLNNTLKISRSGSLPKIQGDGTTSEQQRLNGTLRHTASLQQESSGNSTIQYPVLADTIHLLRPIMPDTLSFALLEAYFNTSPVTNAYLQPCVPPSVYRKFSFLRTNEPRQSSQVLLVSMLWLSAQTADIPLLNASIARRKYVRRKLLELTTRLLKPLNEVSLDGNPPRRQKPSSTTQNQTEEGIYSEVKPRNSMNDGLDEIMAYVHLAMVTSASEFKGASLRWWNIAFSLAREAKLYQEILDPLPESQGNDDSGGLSPDSPQRARLQSYRQGHAFGEHSIFASLISEEGKEERRRVWWFLYAIDRQLSLSYNKPLALLDSECQHLRRPCNDALWQSDQSFELIQLSDIGKGPYFECKGASFFGFFLPLAALLGEIVYFVQAQNHPRFGISQSTLLDWKQWEKGISDRLHSYEHSLKCLLELDQVLPDAGLPSGSYPSLSPQSIGQESPIPLQNRISYAYAKVNIHILHVLLAGKWDALVLLEESNTWYSSPAFVATIGHVVDAAKSAESLLDLDPDAHFMPFFLGIYLFQGCVPLIVAADRLKTDAAEIIIKACDTMIRVHEAHIIRMPSEYQILFVSVLRMGLKEMQGRPFYASGDPTSRYRQVFERYSWASEGRGLAG